MRRLILHIGPHKTGTSSFQHWLRDNAATLAEVGLAVPVDLLNANANGAPLAHALLAAPKDRTSAQSDLVTRFEQFCAAHPTSSVILSAERLSQLLFSDRIGEDGKSIRESDRQKEQEALRVHAALASLGFDRIDIILLIRDQVGFLTSAYVQQLKTMNARWDFATRPLPDMPVRRYVDSFRHLSGLGFHVIAAPYRDPKDTRPLPARLIALAGFYDTVKGRVAFDGPHANVSPGFLTMIGLGHVFWNVQRVADDLDPRTLSLLRRGIFAITSKINVQGDGLLNLFAPDQAAQIAARQSRYLEGIEPWTNGLTCDDITGSFPAPGPQSPLSRTSLTPDQRRRVDHWLHSISADVKRADRLGDILDHTTLSDLDASPAGVHAAPLHAAPCLGGIWATLAPDGRRPMPQPH